MSVSLRFTPMVLALATLALAATGVRAAGDASAGLDSVTRRAWTLPNGLRVVTLHVPAGRSVAVTVVYPGGRDQDKPGREGFSRLLAEVQFTAPAGDIPARTRNELGSLRPMGYDLKVARRYTAFTEIASRAQFPGVLHQVATRMRGVNVTPEALASALASVRRQLESEFLGDPGQALYYEVRELAGRADSTAIRRLATGRAIEGTSPREVMDRLAQNFRAPGAVLCVAGNLTGVQAHVLIEHEFGTLPGGSAPPEPTGLPFGPGSGIEARSGLAAPIGVVGCLAPALMDTLHPNFYLSLLVIGAQFSGTWGPPTAPLTSRFQYALLDDPDVVRFYPAIGPDVRDPAELGVSLASAAGAIPMLVVSLEDLELLRLGVGWLLGGPVPPAILRRVREESGALQTLASTTAVRELWGGEAFWSSYRARFNAPQGLGTDLWARKLSAQENQVRLLFRPR